MAKVNDEAPKESTHVTLQVADIAVVLKKRELSAFLLSLVKTKLAIKISKEQHTDIKVRRLILESILFSFSYQFRVPFTMRAL